MIKDGILVDLTKLEVVKRAKYDDKRIDDLYVKFDGQLIPAAYVFPAENESKVEEQLTAIRTSRDIHDKLVANVYYKIFPKLR